MSAEQAQQTQTSEVPTEPQLLQWSSNYNAQKDISGAQAYVEAAIFANADGSYTYNMATTPIEVPPTTLPSVESEEFEADLAADSLAVIEAYTENAVSRRVLLNLGYRVSVTNFEGSLFTEITTPSTKRINIAMDYLREKTASEGKKGFAPAYKDFPGNIYPAELGAEEQKDGNILIATDPKQRAHDTMAHAFAWAAVPAESFRVSADRGVTLLHQHRKAIGSGIKEQIDAAAEVLNRHYDYTEQNFSNLIFEMSARGVGDPENLDAIRSIGQLLSEIMYGKNATDEQRVYAREVGRDMPARLKIIAEMPEEYIEQALAA